MRVVMTVSDRPHYLKETLDSWRGVRGLDGLYGFTFHIEPGDRRDENLEVIAEFAQHAPASVVAVLNEERLGVLRNPWSAFDDAFSLGPGFTVLAEEDTPVSSDILEYFQWGAQRFEKDPSVLGICCWTDHDGEQDPADTALANDFSPLVWGTWADRWYADLRDTWDKDYSTGDKNGRGAGWDWNIRLRVMGDRTFLFPWVSRSTHIGEHGTHMLPQDFPETMARSWQAHRAPVEYRLIGEGPHVPWPELPAE